jgi:hypothetical protein
VGAALAARACADAGRLGEREAEGERAGGDAEREEAPPSRADAGA